MLDYCCSPGGRPDDGCHGLTDISFAFPFQDANYEHSDEEKSFNSVSPQSTKEEGYASEERPNSQAAPTPTLPTSPLFQATSPPFGKFTRGSGRLSMLANNFDVWADAADRQLLRRSERNIASKDPAFSPKRGQQQPEQIIQKMRQQQRQHQPIQPYDSSLGSMTSASSQENEHHLPRIAVTHDGDASQPTGVAISVIIDMAKELGPLGIHVLPDADTGTILTRGLLIQGIEPGGRIDRDGRLHVGDIIVAIDDHHFVGLEFTQAQDIFRRSLQNESIRLGIVKTSNDDICDSPLYSNANDQRQPPPCSAAEERNADSELGLVEGETRAGQQTKLATVTSTRKHSIDSLPIPSKQHSSAIVVANTRRIGKKYHIQLKKGLQGLGFTITTRDNPAGGLSPIYIKTILPRGAAVQDGRLKPGDRLLEVCGIEMTGKTQEEAVRILRNLSKDSIVDLIVSRQEMEMSPSPLLPRQLPPEKVNEPECSSSNEREVLVFQIQPLNDTTSSGLGLSVKGKTSNSDGKHVDLGIFVKAVLAGGAAWKDGRLRTDDQLLSINEIPLSGKTNGEAMETLRRAMIIKPKSKNEKDCTADEQKDNVITLVVARRVCNSPSHCTESTSEEPLVTYRHQHEASILSSDSFDLSFNADSSVTKGHPATSPLNASHESSCQEDDSYRSSENTVIFCAPSMGPVSTSPTKNGIYDSELSLNDDSGASERFKRDGFGRQSMSEKRHAQLDAKSTDTYRRNKKSREEKLNLATDEDQMATSPSPSSQVSNSRVNNSQMNALSYGEDEHSDRLEAIRRMNSASIKENLPLASNSSSSITPPKPSKSPTKNQMFLFSPCCSKYFAPLLTH